jgi:hypothetical protein
MALSARSETLMAKKDKLGRMHHNMQKELQRTQLMAQLAQLKTNRKVHKLSEGMYKEQIVKMETVRREQEHQAAKLQLETEANLDRMVRLKEMQMRKLKHSIETERKLEAQVMGSPNPDQMRALERILEEKTVLKQQRKQQRAILADYRKKAVEDKARRPEVKRRTYALDFQDHDKGEQRLVLQRRERNVSQLQSKLHARIRQHGNLRNAFKAFDTNGDGRWSPKEFQRCLRIMGCAMMTAEDQAALLAHVSTDGDRYITFNELEAFLGVRSSSSSSSNSNSNEPLRGLRKQKQQQQQLHINEEEIPGFLELEKHGRKPVRWFDDE